MISFGLCSRGEPRDLVIVDELVVAAHAVGHDLEPLARHVDRRAVGQVPAGGEVEAHEGVAGLHQRQEHGLVHLAAGVRLHVGEARSRTAAWPARSRASRRRRRTRSRRSSACPDSPRRTCWSSPSPAPRARRGRRCSPRRSARSRRAGGRVRASMARAISGSASARLAEKKLLDRCGCTASLALIAILRSVFLKHMIAPRYGASTTPSFLCNGLCAEP